MEARIIIWLQSLACDWLDAIFWIITKLGEENFFLLLFLLAYVCYDKKFAIKLMYYYLISVGVNALIKVIVARPRPYVSNSEITNRLPASGYTFPSGHAQGYYLSASVVSTEWYVRNKEKKSFAKLLVPIVLLLIGVAVMISRMYWGQHYITDVLAAMIMAIALVVLLEFVLNKLPDSIKRSVFSSRATIILGGGAGIVLIVMGCLNVFVGFASAKVYKFVGVFLAIGISELISKKIVKQDTDRSRRISLINALLICLLVLPINLVFGNVVTIPKWLYCVIYFAFAMICINIFPIIVNKFVKRDDVNEKSNCK